VTSVPGRFFFICTGVKKTSSAPPRAGARAGSQALARQVVDLAFDDFHIALLGRQALAGERKSRVRAAGDLAPAQAVADRLDRQGRHLLPNSSTSSATSTAPVGVSSSPCGEP
jgi:hypothetical protein